MKGLSNETTRYLKTLIDSGFIDSPERLAGGRVLKVGGKLNLVDTTPQKTTINIITSYKVFEIELTGDKALMYRHLIGGSPLVYAEIKCESQVNPKGHELIEMRLIDLAA